MEYAVTAAFLLSVVAGSFAADLEDSHRGAGAGLELKAHPRASQGWLGDGSITSAVSVDDNHPTACLIASSWLSAKNLMVSNGTSSLPSMRQSPATYSGMGISLFSASRPSVANCAGLVSNARGMKAAGRFCHAGCLSDDAPEYCEGRQACRSSL
jgi:hypothetical protein